ncbi:MAG TPA: hypothetical protein VH306_12275 [Gaiellaceae bacterium]|jgi:hypothetical protein
MDTVLNGHDRTVKLLEIRLEELARLCERSPASTRQADGKIAALAAATRHAVTLELLTAAEAEAIWGAVARRHPDARWCSADPLAA